MNPKLNFLHTVKGTYWLSQPRKQKLWAVLQSSWKHPSHPRRTRVSRWVCWQCSPAPRSQHQQSQWQRWCSLQRKQQKQAKHWNSWCFSNPVVYWRHFCIHDRWKRTQLWEMFKIQVLKPYSPSVCISLEILLTSSWDLPSVSTTRTLGMPLLTPASSAKMASLTCLMARPESRVMRVNVTASCQEQDLHSFNDPGKHKIRWILQELVCWQ